MTATPVLVDAFAGAGGFWLASVGANLTPPVSWMGGKRRLAADLLTLLGLHRGCRVPLLLGDSSWWGWVWPHVLDAEIGPRVSAILRGWRGEDPRALWFRLRDMGPVIDDVAEAAAQLLWLQGRAASGVPVWWESEVLHAAPGDGRASQLAADRGSNGLRKWDRTRAGNVGPANQTHAAEPRLVQWADDGGTRTNAGKGYHGGGANGSRGGGIVDPGTIAHRLDAIRVAVDGIDITIERLDARAFAEKWAPILWRRAVVYLDPPYQGATGYPSTCPRSEVLAIADIWARHGARVVLSEAVGLAADLGPGWDQVCLRSDRKPEWATVYGCDVRAALPPLLRAMAS